MTLGEEGDEFVEVTREEAREEQGSLRSKGKKLVRFLGIEESTILDRRNNIVLSSFYACYFSSSQIYSTLNSVLSSRSLSKTSSEYYMSTKI